MARRRTAPIHESIRDCLGYDANDSNEEVLADWKERTRRVCKPCWELKYCPYGPLVEQSPLLPQLRNEIEDQIERLQKTLQTGISGGIYELGPDQVEERRRWLEDDDLLLVQAWNALKSRRIRDQVVSGQTAGDLPPIERYRVRFDLGLDYVPSPDDFSPEVWTEILEERSRIVEER